MIALISCSSNLQASNHHISSTGEEDSIYVAYSDLKVANSKMIELEYEKEINGKLKEIISNDSIIINEYENVNNTLLKQNKKYKKQRNVFVISAVVFIFTTILNL